MSKPKSGRDLCSEFLGPADPALPPLSFPPGTAYGGAWRRGYYPMGSGWFRDRYLLLFCEDLQPLMRCVGSWDFLTDPEPNHRMVVGRTAHGTLFVLDNVTVPGQDRLKLLDPLGVTFWGDANLNFGSFVSRAIPQGELRLVLDERVYRQWREQSGRYLEPDEILAPIVPLTLGGRMDLANFRVENIYNYYEQTGEIYRNMGRS